MKRPVRLPLPVVVAIFAGLAGLVSPLAAEGWRNMQNMAAGRRTLQVIENRVRQDPRFSRVTFWRSTGGSVGLSGQIDAPRDVLALRTLVDSTVPTAPVFIDVTAKGNFVPGNVSREAFERWLAWQEAHPD